MRLSSRLVACGIAAIALACAGARIVAPEPLDIWGFTAPWDPRSDASVRGHASELDAVVYGWIPLDTATALPTSLYDDTLSRHAPPTTRRMALVTNWQGSTFHPATIRRLAGDTSLLARSAGTLARRVKRLGYGGVVLDLEGVTPADTSATIAVARAFTDSLHAHGLGPVGIAVPSIDSLAYPTRSLAGAVDLLVVMLYDEHWATGTPGPIASPAWVRRALEHRVALAGRAHIVAAIPTYGYQWMHGVRDARTIGYQDAEDAAHRAGVALQRDSASATVHAESPGEWELWVSDATSVRALLDVVRSTGVTHVALWRLGLEDPSVWMALDPNRPRAH
ncbi:MAG TPA: glycosyl hydrolase family 18 protein [Gemmatimonadaceae bacterium]|nr:glycosyl hydrolase family 18 protein [Gemmatimonadaceae bacterium]